MRNINTTVRNASLLIAGVLLFMTGSFAQSSKTPQLTDPEIASVAVTANQIDVDYGEIALKRSDNKSIKHFAKTMMSDHTAIIGQAVKLAKKLKVTPKTNAVTKSLLAGAKKTKAMLNSKKGKAFDKAYIDNEVAYHKAVIGAVKKVLIPQADNKQLKDLLKSVMPLLEHHLKMAEMVQKKFQ